MGNIGPINVAQIALRHKVPKYQNALHCGQCGFGSADNPAYSVASGHAQLFVQEQSNILEINMSDLKRFIAMLAVTMQVATLATPTLAQQGLTKPFAKVCNNGSMAGTGTGGQLCPANPVQGPRPDNWGCTLDRSTFLLWEIKTPTGLTDFRSRFSNVDNLVPGQLGNGQSATQYQIDFTTNSIGYVNDINKARLCRHIGWERPTLSQIQNIATWGVSPQLPVAFFPDLGFPGSLTQHTSTLTSTLASAPTQYQGFLISNGGVIATNRISANAARLVTSWKGGGNPCGGPNQERCPGESKGGAG
jgi:hypothetical protein